MTTTLSVCEDKSFRNSVPNSATWGSGKHAKKLKPYLQKTKQQTNKQTKKPHKNKRRKMFHTTYSEIS